MAIITFWSNGKEQTGQTLSLAAISTYAAVKFDKKVLVISTTNRDATLQNGFIARKNVKTLSFGMFAPRAGNAAMQNGMVGLVRMARSNRVTSDMIRNYTKVVFNEALEILYTDSSEADEGGMEKYYPEIIKLANQYYDMVFVDLDTKINQQVKDAILQESNVIVANISQRLSSIDNFMEERKHNEFLASKKTLILIGRYDRYSKYTSKNITRYMKEKHQVLTVPYNTLLYDASEEAGIPDYFINFLKNPNLDSTNRNYLFFREINRAVEAIQTKLYELGVSI